MPNEARIKTMKNIKGLKQELYRNPKNAAVLVKLGLRFLGSRRYKESIRWFERALILDTYNIEAINGLAMAYLKSGLFYSARKYVEKSLSLSSDNPDIRRSLSGLKKCHVDREEKVTVYVPCYNGSSFIARCIEGILAQSYPVQEILIIDDCSNDSTKDIACRYPVKIISHEENKGLASARNTAIRLAQGDYIAAIDVDVVLDKYWLEYMMSNFNSDAVGGCGGKLLEQNTLTVVDRWRQVNMAQNWGKKRKINPYAIVGSNTVYRRKCLEEAGGYNEKFTHNHEDTDLSLRVKMLRFKLVYDPRAGAHHLRSDNKKTLLYTYWRYYKTPEGELRSSYVNFITLRNRMNYNFEQSIRKVLESLRNKRFHLLYLDILSGFWNTLEDIIYIGKYSKLPSSVVAQTFLACLAGFRYLLENKKGVSKQLLHFILEDLKDLLSLLKTEYKPYIGDFAFISQEDYRKFQKKYKKIRHSLPRADFKFIHYALALWRRGGGFNLKPLEWKMVEVSAGRIRYEERSNPNSMPGFRVMLVNPPWRSGRRLGVRAGSRWPQTMDAGGAAIPGYLPFPFFLAYATAVLKKNGINALIIDAIAEGLSDEEFLERVRGFSPDLVLIEAATASIENDLGWAKNLKEISEGTKIVFAGTHVSALGEGFLLENPEVDYLIIGEYEFTLSELVNSIEKNVVPKDISGIVYRDKSGQIFSNGRTKGVSDLDKLPFPERLTLPIYNYNDSGGTGTPGPTVQLMASRGCPFGCVFCLWPQVLYGDKKYRAHNPIRVVDEVEQLIEEYGFKGIYFDDDTFNIGKERILKICKEIKRRHIKVPWSIMARADTSDYQTLKAMKDAGLCALKFGVESASQELIDNCGKHLDLRAVEKAVEDCKKLGIKTHLTFTFGLPQETKKTIKDTIIYALRLNSNSAQFSLTTPFPGTEYYNLLDKRRLLLTKDWKKYDGNRHAVIRGENLSARELEKMLKEAKTIWNSHCQQRELSRHSWSARDIQGAGNKKCKGKIAIVDLLFRWPPIGGASCDIAGVGRHLTTEGFSVQMFVPLYEKLFVRGVIAQPLSFPVHQIYFKKATFTPENISQRLKRAVDGFDPEYVLISDGWGFKPYVAWALREYKTYLRFYAYENLCLIGHGTLLREGLQCPYNFLSHRDKCLECVNKMVLHKRSKHYQIKELLLSHGLTGGFHELVKRSIRSAHGIIVSNSILAKMLSGLNKSIHIVPGGVDINKFSGSGNGKIRYRRKNILMTGRVDDDEKGLSVLMASSEKLWRKRRDFLVSVTSKKKINKPFIKSIGWFPFDKLPRLYQRADICVFPSLWPEPFGLVAVEAMAAGKPVIASRIGGLKRIVVDKETGFLVEPGNVDELAAKIEILLDDVNLRKKMGQKARKRAEEKYDWNKIIKKYYLPLFTL